MSTSQVVSTTVMRVRRKRGVAAEDRWIVACKRARFNDDESAEGSNDADATCLATFKHVSTSQHADLSAAFAVVNAADTVALIEADASDKTLQTPMLLDKDTVELQNGIECMEIDATQGTSSGKSPLFFFIFVQSSHFVCHSICRH